MRTVRQRGKYLNRVRESHTRIINNEDSCGNNNALCACYYTLNSWHIQGPKLHALYDCETYTLFFMHYSTTASVRPAWSCSFCTTQLRLCDLHGPVLSALQNCVCETCMVLFFMHYRIASVACCIPCCPTTQRL